MRSRAFRFTRPACFRSTAHIFLSSPCFAARWASGSTAATASVASKNNNVGRLAYDASKAGLQKVNKAHVQAVIDDATNGSAFQRSEQRKEAARVLRHRALVEKLHSFRQLPPDTQAWFQKEADAMVAELESTRGFSRRFIHIDLDMFYAAVEEKFNPKLHDRPFAVGSFAMLATSNYLAREFGVRSGMPGFIAKKLCPELWIQPLHFDLYRAEAAAVRAVAAEYDSHYVTVGLDEVTMDVTEYLEHHRRTQPDLTAEDVCTEFRERVFKATALTCSGGISHTAAFAKLASNVRKPNGQHAITLATREEVLSYVRRMPVRDAPGIGVATEGQLRALGIILCGDFLDRRAELRYLFADKTLRFYLSAGLGLVRTHVDRTVDELKALESTQSPAVPVPAAVVRKWRSSKPKPKTMAPPLSSSAVVVATAAPGTPLRVMQKSTGKSVTVSRGLPSKEAFTLRLRQLARGAREVLLEQGTGTRHVCLHTTNHDFVERSRSTTLLTPTNNLELLLKAVMRLATPVLPQHRDFRLIGVTFQKLQRMEDKSSIQKSRAASSRLAAVKAMKRSAHARHYPKRRTGELTKAAAGKSKKATTKVARTLPNLPIKRKRVTPWKLATPSTKAPSSSRNKAAKGKVASVHRV